METSGKDKIVKVLKVLIFIVYCVCAVLSVVAFLSFSFAAFASAAENITAERLIWKVAALRWVTMSIATGIVCMPIATILLRIAFRRELAQNAERKLLVYVPLLLIWGEYAMAFAYLAMNLLVSILW